MPAKKLPDKTAGGPGNIGPAARKMSPEQRRSSIQEFVRSQGFVTIEYLARQFGVTPQTIRRDINILSKEDLIQRFHGGAGKGSSTENVSYTERKVVCYREKQKIAGLVAGQIPDNSSLFINIGTTTEAVARALLEKERLTVITNNLNVANIMSENENFDIIVVGGMLRHRDGGMIGQATIDYIRQFRVDFGVMGISGIDLDGTLLDFDYREVRASRAIMENSRKVFLAADHTKFGRNAMVRLGSIEEIHGLFTDRQPPAPLVEIMAREEVDLFVA